MRFAHFFSCVFVLASACVSSDHVGVREAPLTFCPDAGPPAFCLFGDVFSDVRTSPALAIDSESWIRAVDGLEPITAQQLLLAVQQSSHTDVVTPDDALARVDQQEVRVIAFRELASERAFLVYEYGAGDNSYGAYFEHDSSEVLASIHDGDILFCGVFAE
jgi:hypothetical protein